MSITAQSLIGLWGDWAVPPPPAPGWYWLVLAAQDASETLKDATNDFILSKATDEDRDVKERFVNKDSKISKDIPRMRQWVSSLHVRSWNPLFCPVLVLLAVWTLLWCDFCWADQRQDQQLQRVHAAAEDLLTESQVSGFVSNHRRS